MGYRISAGYDRTDRYEAAYDPARVDLEYNGTEDPDLGYERTFPFQRSTLFEGLEGFADITADPPALRQAYLQELEQFVRTLRRGCLGDQVDFVDLDTHQHLDVALSRYLASRGARK